MADQVSTGVSDVTVLPFAGASKTGAGNRAGSPQAEPKRASIPTNKTIAYFRTPQLPSLYSFKPIPHGALVSITFGAITCLTCSANSQRTWATIASLTIALSSVLFDCTLYS